MQASEAELRTWMVSALAGDGRDYPRLLAALADRYRAFLARRIAGDVEDIVQDALIALHTRRASYDPTRPFLAWAYAIARYKLIDHLRRHRAHVPIDSLEDMLGIESFENALSAQMDVTALLDTLPANRRRRSATRDRGAQHRRMRRAARDRRIRREDFSASRAEDARRPMGKLT